MTDDEAQAIFEAEDKACQTCPYGERSEQWLPDGDGYYWHNDGVECMCRDKWLCPAVIEIHDMALAALRCGGWDGEQQIAWALR